MKIYEYEHMETYFELNELLWWTVGMLIHADGKSQLSADNSNTYEKKKKSFSRELCNNPPPSFV